MDVLQLNEERKRKGLSIEELAKLANLPKSTVEKILFGITKHPRIDTLQAIERALGIKEEIPPSERTEGEKDWMQLYYALTDENRDLLVKLILAFKDMPPDRRRFVLDAIRLAIAQK